MQRKNIHALSSKEENILFAAERLFAEKGFEGTSTRDISREANANISMISYYFGSKEKLLEKIFSYRMDESLAFTKDVIANPELNEWEKICTVADRYCDRVHNMKTFYQVMQREQLSNKNEQIVKILSDSKKGFLRIYKELIYRGIESGIFKKNPRLELLHATITGTIFSAFTNLALYKSFSDGDEDYSENFFEDIKKHIKIILKHLLGYEQNN